MPAIPISLSELLEPISTDRPAGDDLRWTAEWDRLREARRADDSLSAGKWQKKESKSSDWPLVQQLASALLQSRSKDLQLAMWLTEANVKLQGFPGLRDGLRLCHGLLTNYWDRGLFPPIEDGPQDRSGPFEWLNEKLVDSVLEIPITRARQGADFSLLNLRDSRVVGSETSWRDKDGEIDPERKRAYEAAVAGGRTSQEMFERALSDTPRADFEVLYQEFEQSYQAFKDLELAVDQKFGDAVPSFKEFRAVMNELRQELTDCFEKKQRQEPALVKSLQDVNQGDNGQQANVARGSGGFTMRLPLTMSSTPSAINLSWHEAERLVRSGQVDAGLAQMMRLAASETSGRNRFERKLLLAEVCLSSNREKLARAILEELAELIDRFQLEAWETSDMVGGVWTRLYELYRKGSAPDPERAQRLYERLCRLDPWQALTCSE